MAEKNGNGAEHWEFDFSKVSAAQMDEFTKLQRRMIYRESLKIVRLALVNEPKDWPEDLAKLPFKVTAPLCKQFGEAGKDLEVPSSEDYRFDVEEISAADVEDYMLYAAIGDLRKQAELIARYELSLKKNLDERLKAWMAKWTGAEKKRYEKMDKADLLAAMNTDALMDVPYAVFKALRARFMDEVLNLGKNLNGQS